METISFFRENGSVCDFDEAQTKQFEEDFKHFPRESQKDFMKIQLIRMKLSEFAEVLFEKNQLDLYSPKNETSDNKIRDAVNNACSRDKKVSSIINYFNDNYHDLFIETVKELTTRYNTGVTLGQIIVDLTVNLAEASLNLLMFHHAIRQAQKDKEEQAMKNV